MKVSFKKTLSVCMVLFNRSSLTHKTIESIIKTVPQDWEIEWCLIDNGSTVGNQEWAIDYVNNIPRGIVTFFRALKNPIKQTQAVNQTMNAATGEYMLRVDNDIQFNQGWFQDCIEIIDSEEFKEYGFICPTHHLRQTQKQYHPNLIYSKNKKIFFDDVSAKNQNVPGNIFMKTSVARDIGGFYTPYNLLHADVHYCMVAKHMGYKWGYTWRTQCLHIGGHEKSSTEYSQKAIQERFAEDNRYKEIAHGNLKDKHPQEVEFVQQLSKMLKTRGKKLPFHRNINVLIPSCGRRVELVKMFKEAFSIPRFSGKVYTAGCDEYMPAVYYADQHFVVAPALQEKLYVEQLLDICKKKKISYIFPVIDIDVEILSKHKIDFLRKAGVEVVTPDRQFAEICNDKKKTAEFFAKNEIPAPDVITSFENRKSGKLIIKPRYGFGSKQIQIIDKDYQSFDYDEKKHIIQDYVEGEEFTTDIVTNRMYDIVSLVSRKRVATRGGEIQQAFIVNHLQYYQYFDKVAKALELIGPWCIQYKVNNGQISFIEINPRFGGGVPISSRAGQNQALITLKVLERDFFGYHYRYLVEWGLNALRFDDCIYRYIDTKRGMQDATGEERLKR